MGSMICGSDNGSPLLIGVPVRATSKFADAAIGRSEACRTVSLDSVVVPFIGIISDSLKYGFKYVPLLFCCN